MRMQVILDSSFARPGSAPIWGGKKGESRDWTRLDPEWSGLTMKPLHLYNYTVGKYGLFFPNCRSNLVPRVSHLALDGKMRDPGNEVVVGFDKTSNMSAVELDAA